MKSKAELHEALRAIHSVATKKSDRSYMSIPADPDRDADLILSAAIDELVELREIHSGLSLVALRHFNSARQAEWDAGNQIDIAYRGNELAGEVGEACNVIKKLARHRLGIKGSRDTIAHLAEELADVIICVDLIALGEGIDLGRAVVDKFNATSVKVGLKTRFPTPASE